MNCDKIKLALVIGDDNPNHELAVVDIERMQALNETTFILETSPFTSWIMLADGAGTKGFTKEEIEKLIQHLK